MSDESNQQMIREDAAVVKALLDVGLEVRSVYDLVNSSIAYNNAIPILIRMLFEVEHDRIVEGVARALTAKEARPVAAEPLLRRFESLEGRSKSQQYTKAAIANAVAFTADDAMYSHIARVLADRKHGWPRMALMPAIVRLGRRRTDALALVRSLRDDNSVEPEVIQTLGKIGSSDDITVLREYLSHANPDCRKRAMKAIERIQHRTGKTATRQPKRAN